MNRHEKQTMAICLVSALLFLIAQAGVLWAGQQKFSKEAVDNSIMAEFMADSGWTHKQIVRFLDLPRSPNIDVDAARWLPGEQLWHSPDLKVAIVFKIPEVQGRKLYDMRNEKK